jgi:tellurite methyltransferase
MNPTPFLEEFANHITPSSAIDIGCGNGRNSIYLKQHNWHVTAVDIKAQNIPGVPFIQSSLVDLKSAKSYKLVLCLMVLHFLSNNDDVERNISLLKELTQTHGYVLISVFTNENKNNSRPYLFERNEIESYFSNWQLIEKQHELANAIVEDGQESRYWVIRYIFQKTH